MVFMNTVSQNKQAFIKREIKRAKAAWKIYGKLIFPSTKDFMWMIQSYQTKNCEVTVRDIDVAHAIWGKDISALKGNTTRSKPTHVAGDIVKIPREYKLLQSLYLLQQIFSL